MAFCNAYVPSKFCASSSFRSFSSSWNSTKNKKNVKSFVDGRARSIMTVAYTVAALTLCIYSTKMTVLCMKTTTHERPISSAGTSLAPPSTAKSSFAGNVSPVLLSRGKVAISIMNTSFDSGNAARKAADGNKDTNDKQDSCFSTISAVNHPWWRIDLKYSAGTVKVKVTNKNELRDFYVILTDENRYENIRELKDTHSCGGKQSNSTAEIECGSLQGRYVYILVDKSDTVLTLCEVEVFGVYTSECESDISKCNVHASCLQDKESGMKVCVCAPGYEGNGVTACARSLQQFTPKTLDMEVTVDETPGKNITEKLSFDNSPHTKPRHLTKLYRPQNVDLRATL